MKLSLQTRLRTSQKDTRNSEERDAQNQKREVRTLSTVGMLLGAHVRYGMKTVHVLWR